MPASPWYRWSSPPAPAAIAIIELRADIPRALATLGIRPVPTGEARRRAWPGVDDIVLAAISDSHALLFPHGGAAIARRAGQALNAAGLTERADDPEPQPTVEARMVAALARARSPLAIDLLLRQPELWRRAAADPDNPALRHTPQDSARLRFLIDPPTVAAWGPPNIGKSTLLNALAQRTVSIVADAPGTTRDHVGVLLNLGGLVVRYLDLPGIGPLPTSASPDHAALDAQAQHRAHTLAAQAHLLFLCADPTTTFIQPPKTNESPERKLGRSSQAPDPTNASPDSTPATTLPPFTPPLRLLLRADLPGPRHDADTSISAIRNQGLDDLTATIRNHLIPAPLLATNQAWQFWDKSRSGTHH